MTIYLNGQPEKMAAGIATLSDLLKLVGMEKSAVSVSLNDLMVPREEWGIRFLSDFDRVDFV